MPSAAQVQWAKFRVTLVTLAALAIVVVFVYLLTGGTLFQTKVDLYLYMPDATGLTLESPVRVNGVEVGTVKSVGLSGSKQPDRVIRATLRVETDHLGDIPIDSTAQLSADSLIGDKFVDISRGRSPATVRATGEVRFKEEPQLLKTLDLAGFERQLRDFDVLLSDIEQGRTKLGQFVLGDQVYNRMVTAVTGFDRSLKDAVDLNTPLGQLVYSDELEQKILRPFADIDNSLARIQSGQGDIGRLLTDSAQYAQLGDALTSLQKTVAQVRASPWLQSDDEYNEWQRQLASMIQAVDQVNAGSWFSNSSVYDNLQGFTTELSRTLKEFDRDPQKFMWFKLF